MQAAFVALGTCGAVHVMGGGATQVLVTASYTCGDVQVTGGGVTQVLVAASSTLGAVPGQSRYVGS